MRHKGYFPQYGNFNIEGTQGEEPRPAKPCLTDLEDVAAQYTGLFPVGYNLTEAMLLYWRVQEYTISGVLTGTIPDEEDPDVFTFSGTIGTAVETEADLVCGQQSWVASAGVDNSEISLYAPPIFEIGDLYGPPLARDVDGLFRPCLYLRVGNRGEAQISSDPDDGDLEPSAAIFTVGSKTIPLYVVAGVYESLTGTVELTATQYWTYGGKWDATTGERN